MKNIALIKSIVATSISSANPAELTEHIAALIQAHPEETREKLRRIYECNIRHPRVEHGQGRVETLTTSIYLGEIRDRFFFFLPKHLNII